MSPAIINRITSDIRERYNTAISTIGKEMVFSYTALVLIFLLAFMVRIFSMLRPFEVILAANDPFSHANDEFPILP